MLLLLLPGPATQGEQQAGDAAVRFQQAYEQQDWLAAITAGSELEAQHPGSIVVSYNLACVYARHGDTSSALAWLKRSARNGLTAEDRLNTDTDLASLRELAGFSAVLEQVRSNRSNRESEISRRFAALPPLLELPKGWDRQTPAPLLICLHGYGGRADNLPPLWRRAARKLGAIVVAPWGQQPVGDGSSWTDLHEALTIVELSIAWAREQYPIDTSRIVLSGFSQGGTMAHNIAVRRPQLLAGVIPMACGYDQRIDAPPTAADNAPRFYFMVGAEDRNTGQTRQAAAAFEAAGYRSELRIYPRAGHSFPVIGPDRELTRALRATLGQ